MIRRVILLLLVVTAVLGMTAPVPCHGKSAVTLKLVQWKTEARGALQEIIDDFQRKYPGIKVEMEIPGQYDSYIQAKAAVNEFPDIVGLYGLAT